MKKVLITIMILMFLLVTLIPVVSSCKEADNPVFLYMKDAELQYEGKIQKENIKIALKDILTLKPEQLKKKRYKDYKGKENQWDLPTLIGKHFVPRKKGLTVGKNFYEDVKSKKVQDLVKKILDKLNK